MERVMKQSRKCTTFTYDVIDLTKEQMLEYVCDILNDDDITGHGLILTQPTEETDWPGFVKEIPLNPEGKEFAEEYKDIKITCITAVMEYHGQSMMISYQPEESIISVILPSEFTVDIDEIEKNVIPDAIDHNPQ